MRIYIVIYPFNDVESFDGSNYTYKLNSLPREYIKLSESSIKTYFDVCNNIVNRFIHLFFPTCKDLEYSEDYFRKNILEYKKVIINLHNTLYKKHFIL
jgi:hypothetical protein